MKLAKKIFLGVSFLWTFLTGYVILCLSGDITTTIFGAMLWSSSIYGFYTLYKED